MQENKINNILKLNNEERYFYFIRKVADFEKIWGLYGDDGWATLGNSNMISIPFWPEAEFARICATAGWGRYAPKSIDLIYFLENWINGMELNNQISSIFMTPNSQGINVKPQKLQLDLEYEIEKYN